MAKKFTDLRARMSPVSRTRSEAKAQKLLAEMSSVQLRQENGFPQEGAAELKPQGRAAFPPKR